MILDGYHIEICRFCGQGVMGYALQGVWCCNEARIDHETEKDVEQIRRLKDRGYEVFYTSKEVVGATAL